MQVLLNKKNLKALITGVLLITSTPGLYAQATASASASVTIVTPVALTLENDLNFGNVAVSSSAAGTVILDAANKRTNKGAAVLPANSGSVSAAQFTVTGAPGYVYAITLPASCVITDGSHDMTINNFTSIPSGTGTLVGGSSTLKVGATLNVLAGQPAGAYRNTTGFEVTVNYN